MEKLFDDTFFSQLHAVSQSSFWLSATASQTSVQAGLRKSKAKGSSVEFSDFREYLPGDDIRRLDWNAYARLGKLYMKLYMEEREGIFSLYLDLSPSMDYGSAVKARQVLRIAAVISWLALSGDDRVRICICGYEDEKIPMYQNFHGSAAFSRVLNWLEAIEQHRQNRGDGETKKADFRTIWEQIRRFPPSAGGSTILVSDFMPEDVEEQVKYLRLYKKQNILLVQVLAPEELQPDFLGTNQLVDMEEGSQMRITLSPGLLREYKKGLEALCRKLEQTARRYQGHYVRVSSVESATAFLWPHARNAGHADKTNQGE